MSSPPPDSLTPDSRWVGRVIDNRYKIVEVLGGGAMGAVFVAEHLRLRKHVAFKTVNAEFAAHSQAEARFTREALATGRLDHPHVASAIDFGPLPEGGYYLVTQLVRGEPLSARLAAGPMPWPQVCQLGSQIADALAAAHAIGIIHRDLKPDNILLERRSDGALHARVVDFGIARISGENAGTIADIAQPLTRMGAVIGTPGYMPPEQGTGQAIDLRVDLYALGVILWEAVTGQQLWQGDTLQELLGRQLSRPAPSLRGDVPEAMAAMIERLLARLPADRPASAIEVRDELRRLALGNELGLAPAAATSGAPVAHAPPTPAAPQIAATPAAPAASTGPAPGSMKPVSTIPTLVPSAPRPAVPTPRRSRRLWLGAAVTLLVLVLLAVYGPDSKPDRRPRPTTEELLAEVPAAYAEDVKMLLESRHREARKLASEAIAEAPADDRSKIPEYLRDLAEFERTRDCDDRQAILSKLAEADEIRALSTLELLAEAQTDTCDLRQDFARVIARLSARILP